MKKGRNTRDRGEADEFFKVYEEYAKNLRSWFVAFGIGGPVLFITNSSFFTGIKNQTPFVYTLIIIAFFSGTGLQIVLAWINKYVNWEIYYGKKYPDKKKKWLYRGCGWISDKIEIDFAIDIITIMLFAVAIIFCIRSI